MGLHKGQTNNKDGRPKGTPNVLTNDMRTVLKGIIAKELETIPTTLETMQPKERLEMVIKLIPYILPKVETIKSNSDEPWDLNSWG